MSILAKKTSLAATFVKQIPKGKGDMRLYHCDTGGCLPEYVIVSAVNAVFSGPETYIFEANDKGEVVDYGELEGSFRGELNHAKALANAGYSIVIEAEFDDKIVPVTKKVAAPSSGVGKFFHFHQNNSGGRFTINDDVSVNVIIEATSADDANERAEGIGIYFDGSDDCSCCGSRWHTVYGEGNDVPKMYGDVVNKDYRPKFGWSDEKHDVIVHYMDGRKEYFG